MKQENKWADAVDFIMSHLCHDNVPPPQTSAIRRFSSRYVTLLPR